MANVDVQREIMRLRNSLPSDRIAAAEALGQARDAQAVLPLLSCLIDDIELNVKMAAGNALGEIGDARAINVLLDTYIDACNVSNLKRLKIVYRLEQTIDNLLSSNFMLNCLSSLILYMCINVIKLLIIIAISIVAPIIIGGYIFVGYIVVKESISIKTLVILYIIMYTLINGMMAFYLFEEWRRGIAYRKIILNVLKNIHKRNRPNESHYPNLFCTKCALRAQKVVRRQIAVKCITYYICRKCQCSSYLNPAIKQVVGVIDGEGKEMSTGKMKEDEKKKPEDVEIRDDTIYVRLWNEEKKKARNADIDALEIRGGGRPFGVTWAINAVLNELTNDASRPRGYVKTIPVYLRGNPPLQIGDRNILINEFAGIYY